MDFPCCQIEPFIDIPMENLAYIVKFELSGGLMVRRWLKTYHDVLNNILKDLFYVKSRMGNQLD